MKKRLFYLIPLFIFFIVCLFLWRGLSLHPRRIPSTFIGKEIPAFSLQGLSSQDLVGHVSVLNIWATWCINCELEHPVLMDMKDSGVRVYGIAYKDSPADVDKFLKEYGNPYQKIGFDSTGTVSINLGVYGTPETFILDRNGVVRDKVIGAITENTWLNNIKPEVDSLQKEAEDRYAFETPQQMAQFKQLTGELRCLVCQDESLASSNAPLANDLKKEVAGMVRAGKNNKEITDYLVKRYGNYVLYKPPVIKQTYFLWFGPILLLLIGLYFVFRKKK